MVCPFHMTQLNQLLLNRTFCDETVKGKATGQQQQVIPTLFEGPELPATQLCLSRS